MEWSLVDGNFGPLLLPDKSLHKKRKEETKQNKHHCKTTNINKKHIKICFLKFNFD